MRSIPVLECLSSNNWTDSKEPVCYRSRCHFVKSTRFDLDGLRYIENRRFGKSSTLSYTVKPAHFKNPLSLVLKVNM